jgi:hypothetical protein
MLAYAVKTCNPRDFGARELGWADCVRGAPALGGSGLLRVGFGSGAVMIMQPPLTEHCCQQRPAALAVEGETVRRSVAALGAVDRAPTVEGLRLLASHASRRLPRLGAPSTTENDYRRP